MLANPLNNLKSNKEINAAVDMVSKPTSINALSNTIIKLLPFNQNLIVNYSGQDKLSIYDFSKLVAKIFNYDQGLINKCSWEDFNFFDTIIQHLGKENLQLQNIVSLLDREPEIKEINFHRQADFLKNQKEKTTLKIRGSNV